MIKLHMETCRLAALIGTVGIAIGSSRAVAEEPMAMGFVDAGRTVLGIQYAAAGGFAIADLDGDGIDDLAFTGTQGKAVLFVSGKLPDNSVGFKQVLTLPDTGGVSRVLSAQVAGTRHIIVVGGDGTVLDFSGWPLHVTNSFKVTPSITAVAGPLYADNADALVTLTTEHVSAYALDTGTQLWTYDFTGGVDIALAQLDADPALEVIISAEASRVIDGATQATDWQYSGEFGFELATGHLQGDESTQFLGTIGSGFTVFNGFPWAPLWSDNAFSPGIAALATVDLDHNFHDVILEGDAQWGAVHAIDSTTHQLRFTINHSSWGINAVGGADLDGDGVPEIVFASSVSYGSPSIDAVDSKTGSSRWSFASQDGVFSPVAYGDVDGDGQQELVVANYGSLSYASPSRIEVFDAVTHVLKWQSPLPTLGGYDPYSIAPRKVVLRPHVGTTGMDIILAGNSSYDGKIVWIDGVSHTVKFQVYTYGAGGPLVSRDVMDATLVDYDNDGAADLAVASATNNTGAGDAQLHVFSGTDGHVLWASPTMISHWPSVSNVLVTGSSADSSGQLVAVLNNGLVAYNIQDPTSTWTLLAAADGAAYIPDGADGSAFALFQQSGAVTFYAATDRSYRHAISLPSPLYALASLDGTDANLIASSASTMSYVDGVTGTLRARTSVLASSLGYGNNVAMLALGPSAWRVAGGDVVGVNQYLLQMTNDRLMANGFEAN